jgi:hypothetical protein
MATPPVFPPEDPNYKMPFFYGSLSLLWTYYWVDEAIVAPYLRDTRLKCARFSDPEAQGKALISLNFQNYGALLSMAVSSTNEIEFNIHAYPEAEEKHVPVLALADYLRGQEQTKLIGEFRLHVPADNAIAVQAGVTVFGERKFLTSFSYNVPSPNSTDARQFSYTVNDPGNDKLPIYTLTADFSNLVGTPGNASPLTLYSMLPGGPNRPPGGKDMDLIDSRWNMFGLYEEFLNLKPADQKRFTLAIGKSSHEMAVDARKILGKNPKVAAARIFHSPPAAVENRAYYVSLGSKKK